MVDWEGYGPKEHPLESQLFTGTSKEFWIVRRGGMGGLQSQINPGILRRRHVAYAPRETTIRLTLLNVVPAQVTCGCISIFLVLCSCILTADSNCSFQWGLS